MKEIFLSYKSEYFEPLLYGIKKYEYRKRFCDEKTRVYLYLSGKARQVVGILELGKPIRLDLTRDDYICNPETLKRVDEYIFRGNIYAIPICSLTLFKEPLLLDEIRKDIPGFMPPQMYYVLDNHPQLKQILERQNLGEKVFNHKHDEIYFDNLAKSVSELKKTDEYIRFHQQHCHQGDYLSF